VAAPLAIIIACVGVCMICFITGKTPWVVDAGSTHLVIATGNVSLRAKFFLL